MPYFSKKSKDILETCHPKLIALCNALIIRVDFSILSGFRTEEEQKQMLLAGTSHLGYPHSKHNRSPSEGIDIAPYPIDWDGKDGFVYLAGHMMGLAISMDIKLRWGGDWNMNFIMTDQRFHDLGHFEIID